MLRFSLLSLVIVGMLYGCNWFGKKNLPLKTSQDKASYAIGQQIGRGMQSQGVEINVDILAMSISDVLAGKKSRLSDEEMQAAIQDLQQEMREKQIKLASDNKKKGEDFLEETKKKEGVKVTASGLQYEILTEGKGPTPKETDVVKVHYAGTLIDGTEFDSSFKRNEPAEFPVTGVIPGWTEALKMMPVGSKWKLYIPADLAYGERGRPSIPPNSPLIFEVELLEIVKK